MDQEIKKNRKYEVLTSDGFKDFDGMTCIEKTTFLLELDSGESIRATEDHLFFSKDDDEWKELRDLDIGEYIETKDGSSKVSNISFYGTELVSDLVNVKDVHSFIANDINVHNCVYLDELAFVPMSIARPMWVSLAPTLSTGGKCIVTSTPNIEEDQFAELWFGAINNIDEYGNETELGKNGFKAFFADWTAHPERDEEWERNERASMSQEKFEREHLCRFIAFEETLINSAHLAKLSGTSPLYTESNVRWYSDLNPNSTYVVSLDPSMGTGGDFSAIQVLELPSLTQVAEWQHNKTRIEDQVSLLRDITRKIENKGCEVYWSVENNGLGEAALVCIRELGEDTFGGGMLHDPKQRGRGSRKGFTTTERTKNEACAMMKRLIENNRLTIRSSALIAELKTFVSKGGSYGAKLGTHDDLVMAMILALRMVDFIATWDDRSQAAIKTNVDLDDDNDDYDTPMPIAFI